MSNWWNDFTSTVTDLGSDALDLLQELQAIQRLIFYWVLGWAVLLTD